MLISQFKHKLFLLIILTFLVAGCSIISQYSSKEKEALLIRNIQKLETFKLEGIIEVNYKIFSFRKNIVIRRNEELFRTDIFDSGILGLSPSPFLTAVYDSVLVIRLSGNNDPVEISKDKLLKDSPFLEYLLDSDKILEFKQQIIKDHELQLDDVIILFSDKMEIIQISQTDKPYSIQLNYGSELEEIKFIDDEKIIADIIIDKISFSDIKIKN